MKILATSDLHLGRKSSGTPGNAEQSSSKYTWSRIVDLCIKENVDVLLLLGDIVDQDNRYYEAIGSLQSGFEKLKKPGIAVYMVAGNHDHDVLVQIAGNGKYENVHLLGVNGKWEVKSFSKDGKTVQFAGWSFPQRYVKEDPLLYFNSMDIDVNYPAIGLLHCDIYNRDSNYGPVAVDSLVNKKLDVWVLGHIHKPDVLQKDSPCIFYPGSPHAFSSKEPGMHGVVLLEIEDTGNIKTKTIALSPIRYERVSIDVTNCNDEVELRDKVTSVLFRNASEMIEELEGVSFLVYDVLLEGVHSKIKEIESWVSLLVNDYEQELPSGTLLTVRKVENIISPAIENLEELAKHSSPDGILAQTILALQGGDTTPFVEELIKEWKKKNEKVVNAGVYQPLQTAGEHDILTDEEATRYILQECKKLLGELITQHK